jgi:hypothetical protein
MSRNDAADVFARRTDADWQMFCRGQRDEGDDAGGQFSGGAGASDEPVELAPGDVPPAEAADAGDAALRHFGTRIVGLPYPNPDGTSRREAVLGLRRWELVRLAHRPDNPVDANAVAVLRSSDGRQLGYLPAAVAKDVVTAARDLGARYLALVSDVTGGTPDDLISVSPVAAHLLILVLEGGATKAAARRYLLGLVNRRATA